MVVEFLSQGGAGNDQRLTGLDASQDAGAPRGESFVERVTERIHLVEQAKYAAFVGDKAGNDHVFGDAELGGAGLEILLDIVDAADKGSDIDQEWLQPACLQYRADLEQRVGLLARIDRSEMADHQPAARPRRGETLT